MPKKDIPDIIQNILDDNKGFMTLRKLNKSIGSELRFELGLKSDSSAEVIMKKLEPLLEDRFIFHAKGRALYIMTPDPSDIVLEKLSAKRPYSPKKLSQILPFKKLEVSQIVNELVSEGRAKIILNEKLEARILLASFSEMKPAQEIEYSSGEYTVEKFREAFDELNNDTHYGGQRIFVRIPELRRKLGWPREVFDEMLRDLRNRHIVQISLADETITTPEDISDCFIDENNYRMGRVAWNVR